ncbi:hypothetical protein ACA910_003969 [Epithemia clementina (nom. ined.)]
MTSWMRRQRPDKVEALFQDMTNRYNELVHLSSSSSSSGNDYDILSKKEALRPSAKNHTTRLQAWSKAGNPEKASEALRDWIADSDAATLAGSTFRGGGPGTQEFNAVLIAWLRSQHPDAALMADRGLQEMMEIAANNTNHHRFHCHPNLQSYTTVISAYAKLSTPQAGTRALELFRQLRNVAHQAKDPSTMEPDFFVYAGVLAALLRSGDPNAAPHVRHVLFDLENKDRSFWQKTASNPRQAWSLIHKLRRNLRFSNLKEDMGEFHRRLDHLQHLANTGAAKNSNSHGSFR